jgi:hypothetical protein
MRYWAHWMGYETLLMYFWHNSSICRWLIDVQFHQGLLGIHHYDQSVAIFLPIPIGNTDIVGDTTYLCQNIRHRLTWMRQTNWCCWHIIQVWVHVRIRTQRVGCSVITWVFLTQQVLSLLGISWHTIWVKMGCAIGYSVRNEDLGTVWCQYWEAATYCGYIIPAQACLMSDKSATTAQEPQSGLHGVFQFPSAWSCFLQYSIGNTLHTECHISSYFTLRCGQCITQRLCKCVSQCLIGKPRLVQYCCELSAPCQRSIE